MRFARRWPRISSFSTLTDRRSCGCLSAPSRAHCIRVPPEASGGCHRRQWCRRMRIFTIASTKKSARKLSRTARLSVFGVAWQTLTLSWGDYPRRLRVVENCRPYSRRVNLTVLLRRISPRERDSVARDRTCRRSHPFQVLDHVIGTLLFRETPQHWVVCGIDARAMANEQCHHLDTPYPHGGFERRQRQRRALDDIAAYPARRFGSAPRRSCLVISSPSRSAAASDSVRSVGAANGLYPVAIANKTSAATQAIHASEGPASAASPPLIGTTRRPTGASKPG